MQARIIVRELTALSPNELAPFIARVLDSLHVFTIPHDLPLKIHENGDFSRRAMLVPMLDVKVLRGAHEPNHPGRHFRKSARQVDLFPCRLFLPLDWDFSTRREDLTLLEPKRALKGFDNVAWLAFCFAINYDWVKAPGAPELVSLVSPEVL
ncbi:uncharacterized protein BDV17DRAFT_294899 [Aspergillus undulatus]|uniref:uncharacterized protein n=1 Tax=Aspergillus undulatus TaxID=1810928 RepID=UPI003CCDF071